MGTGRGFCYKVVFTYYFAISTEDASTCGPAPKPPAFPTMSTDVQLADTPQHRMAYVGDLSAPDAQMTFSRAGSGMIIIDHTEVNESLRGQGVGRKLLDRLVAFAREEKLKVIALCPYAKSVFDKDASIRDVLR